MKRLLLAGLSCVAMCTHSYAQQSVPVNKNMQAVAASPYKAGSFNIDRQNGRGIMEHINVNYAIDAAPVVTKLSVELRTADPLPLCASVTDAQGKEQLQWKPAAISYFYKDVIDVSRLVPGQYKLNVMSADRVISYSIPFIKVAQ